MEAKAHDLVMQRLTQAFGFRNDITGADSARDISDLMLDGSITMLKGKYILKKKIG